MQRLSINAELKNFVEIIEIGCHALTGSHAW